jgi:hypothetical protein
VDNTHDLSAPTPDPFISEEIGYATPVANQPEGTFSMVGNDGMNLQTLSRGAFTTMLEV